MTFAVVLAKPEPQVAVAYSAPLIASPVVTATSSQYVARNHNGFAAPLVAAAYTSGVAAPYVSAPVAAAYTASPYAAAYSYSPYAYSAYPYVF